MAARQKLMAAQPKPHHAKQRQATRRRAEPNIERVAEWLSGAQVFAAVSKLHLGLRLPGFKVLVYG